MTLSLRSLRAQKLSRKWDCAERVDDDVLARTVSSPQAAHHPNQQRGPVHQHDGSPQKRAESRLRPFRSLRASEDLNAGSWLCHGEV